MAIKASLLFSIESSCDDSACAITDIPSGRVIAEHTANLSFQHAKFGGVVPEIAGRGHLAAFTELIQTTMNAAGCRQEDIAAFAVTVSPGLIGSLLVGVTYAKSLAWLFNKPVIPVDHIEGHLFSGFIGKTDPTFPFSALVISGGHTLLVRVEGVNRYRLLGRSTDDSVGEAFDKTAKILGFLYPGGPTIDTLSTLLDPQEPDEMYTIPLRGKKTLDFSFSGLKTAVLYQSKELGLYHPEAELITPEVFLATADATKKSLTVKIAAKFQRTVIRIFEERISQTMTLYPSPAFHICGGVAANSGISAMIDKIQTQTDVEFVKLPLKYCGDNAAMIGCVGRLYYIAGQKTVGYPELLSIEPNANGIFSRLRGAGENA